MATGSPVAPVADDESSRLGYLLPRAELVYESLNVLRGGVEKPTGTSDAMECWVAEPILGRLGKERDRLAMTIRGAWNTWSSMVIGKHGAVSADNHRGANGAAHQELLHGSSLSPRMQAPWPGGSHRTC